MKKILFIPVLLTLSWQFIFADTMPSGSIMYPFLDIAPSARAAALADSVCGLSGDPGSAFSNPSQLAGIGAPQVSLTYGKWFADTDYQNLSGATDLSFGSIGAQILYLNLGQFEKRDDTGVLLDGKMNAYNIAATFAYALKPMARLSAGAAIKIIGQSMADSSRATAAFDAGAQYKFDKISVGFALNNLGAAPGYGFPITIRSGASSIIDLAAAHKITLGLDAKYEFQDELTLSMGAEYAYSDTVFARLGYRLRSGSYQYDVITGFTAGAGVKAGGFVFDYALVPFGDLGLTQRATVSYVFYQKPPNAPEKQQETQPEQTKELMKRYNAVKADPKNMKAWASLAKEYYALGSVSYALTTVTEALKISPKNAELNKLKEEYKKRAGTGTGRTSADK